MSNIEVNTLHMGQAKCALDLGDGSERGEYVDQDYILHVLGRPHRGINLMFCYYPLDKGWPARASTLAGEGKVGFAWDYAYDDYFPYQGGLDGKASPDREPFKSMADVRRHGQDVILTLTVDCKVGDEHLIKIAEDLRPYGRLMLRINHEATGTWFAFNKRYTYQQVADFYVRFHKIIKKHAPHIKTILCIGDPPEKESGKMKYEDEFAEAISVADFWSTDTYLALHWGWPFDIAEPGGNSHKRVSNKMMLQGFNDQYERFKARSGDGASRPLVVSEFNADGDVTGPFEQAEQLEDFYQRLPKESPCVKGVTFYQFRDRGRLGLEIEDPSNSNAGYAQPILETYKKILNMDSYLPQMTTGGKASFPAKMRWGGSEDSDGISINIKFESNPVFCEITFSGEDINLNLMMEINGTWFYKKPGVKTIDLISAFFTNRLKGKKDIPLRIFSPPPEGVNDPSQGKDWEINYHSKMENEPELRIRYQPAMPMVK
jgi:hypothetical protein